MSLPVPPLLLGWGQVEGVPGQVGRTSFLDSVSFETSDALCLQTSSSCQLTRRLVVIFILFAVCGKVPGEG